jgi:hypothetical protein
VADLSPDTRRASPLTPPLGIDTTDTQTLRRQVPTSPETPAPGGCCGLEGHVLRGGNGRSPTQEARLGRRGGQAGGPDGPAGAGASSARRRRVLHSPRVAAVLRVQAQEGRRVVFRPVQGGDGWKRPRDVAGRVA